MKYAIKLFVLFAKKYMQAAENIDQASRYIDKPREKVESNKIMKLKPCPFCGNHEIEIEREGTSRASCVVLCGWCGCKLESNEIGYGEAWNRRAYE